MKVHAERKPLLDAFNLASSVASAKSPKPILRHVLMVADPDRGTSLVASNDSLYVRIPVAGCMVAEAGSAILDGERAGAALASYPDDAIKVSCEGAVLTISGGRSKAALASEDASLFPSMPGFPDGPSWSIMPADLCILADRTAFAVDGKGSATFALGGCSLELGEGEVGMVGTDGRRLARMVAPCGGRSSDVKATIPPAALKLADKLFGGDAGPIRLAFSQGLNPSEPNLVHLIGDSGEVASRLVEGRFPRYGHMLRDSSPSVAVVRADALRSSVRCASIVTSEDTRGVDMEFSPGTLSMSAVNADRGKSDATMDIDYDGKPLSFRLDSRHLLDALARVPDEAMVSIGMVDDKQSVIMSLADGWNHVLLPLTVIK